MSNHYVVYIKFIQRCMPVISQNRKNKKQNTEGCVYIPTNTGTHT